MQILIAVVFGFVVPSLLAFLVWEWEGRRRLWRVAAIFGSMWVGLGTTHVLIGWFDVWGRTEDWVLEYRDWITAGIYVVGVAVAGGCWLMCRAVLSREPTSSD
jgi:hypothetical protein